LKTKKNKIAKSYDDSHVTTRYVLFEKIPFNVIYYEFSPSRLYQSSNTYSRNRIYNVQTSYDKEYYEIINGVLDGVFILKSDFKRIKK
jgi:hypothetical protein